MSTNLSLQNKSIADIDNLEYLNRAWKRLPWGKFISINSAFVDITGNLNNAIYLSQCLYWQVHGTRLQENDGYTIKPAKEMEKEVGLTETQQRRCREQLIAKNLISTKMFAKTHMGHKVLGTVLGVCVNMEELTQQLCNHFHIDLNELGVITPDSWKIGDHPLLRNMHHKKITYHRDLVDVTDGDIYSAIMLSLEIRSCLSQRKNYVSYSISQWQRMLLMGERRQASARKNLRNKHLITEKQLIPKSNRIFTSPNGKLILEKLGAVLDHKRQLQNEVCLLNHDRQPESQAYQQSENNHVVNTMVSASPVKTQEQSRQFVFGDGKNSENTMLSASPVKTQEYCHQNAGIGTAKCGKTPVKTQEHIITTTKTTEKTTTTTTPTLHATYVSTSHWGGGGGGFISYHFQADNLITTRGETTTRGADTTLGAEDKHSGCLNTENNSPSCSQPEQSAGRMGILDHQGAETKKSPTRKVFDFTALIYPPCMKIQPNFSDEPAKNNPVMVQSVVDTVKAIIPNATADEIQELLDEIAGSKRPIANPIGYFQTLCRRKKDGVFVPMNAVVVRNKRSAIEKRQASSPASQVQNEGSDRAGESKSLFERIDAITDKGNLKIFLLAEYDKEKQRIIDRLSQHMQGSELGITGYLKTLYIILEPMSQILMAYAFHLSETIADAVALRQKIIEIITPERLERFARSDHDYHQRLMEILDMPEFNGQIPTELTQI